MFQVSWLSLATLSGLDKRFIMARGLSSSLIMLDFTSNEPEPLLLCFEACMVPGKGEKAACPGPVPGVSEHYSGRKNHPMRCVLNKPAAAALMNPLT